MGTSRTFYERYWSCVEAPPDRDPLTESRAALFLGALPRGLRVLELGCGNGRASKLLCSRGMKVLGLDVSHTGLKKAHSLGGAMGWVQATCDGQLPFGEETFDAVYCAEVIEHLLDPQTMVQECHRTLKPSGVLFVSTPYHGLIKDVALAGTAFDRHFNVLGEHIRFFTMRSLRKLLRNCGFRVERSWRLGRFWPFWMNMAMLARKA
jgi:2-polyprenyl-3-methyl-5-hydroxy-6-metoxy-1,4-benzoquinol methylase